MVTIVRTIVGEEETSINKDLYYVLLKAGVGNVKDVKKLIKNHKVFVNKKCVVDIKHQVNQYDLIEIDNKTISYPFVYYMINKPKGYVCANKDKENKVITDLFDDEVNCIGRLDKDTTGLLLLTNDTNHLKRLLYPENHHTKIYYVTVDLPLKDELIEYFLQGVKIPGYTCLPSKLEIVDDYHCNLTIVEGRYHQVKKMFYSCGYRVVELHRTIFGPLKLEDGLDIGMYRKLNDQELKKLEVCINV